MLPTRLEAFCRLRRLYSIVIRHVDLHQRHQQSSTHAHAHRSSGSGACQSGRGGIAECSVHTAL